MPRLLKSIGLISAVLIFFSTIVFAAEESITITTYYPSPYGSYRELRAQRIAIGDNYINGSLYCWEGICTNTIDANADLVVEGKVGIGTTSPTLGKVQIYTSNGSTITTGLVLDNANTIGKGTKIQFAQTGNANDVGSIQNYFDGTKWLMGLGTYTQSGTTMYLTQQGNVGIGTITPTTGKLVVSGGNIDVTGNRIINLATPIDSTDAATKGYVDAAGGGKVSYEPKCPWGTGYSDWGCGSAFAGTCIPPACAGGYANLGTGCAATGAVYSGYGKYSCGSVGYCERYCVQN